jgi:hypothetical protein
MRRFVALASAAMLVASLAGSAAATSAVPDSSSFVGNFELLNPDGTAAGWAKVEIQMPTQQHLVPGSYDFVGAKSNSIREGHAVLGVAGFWHDSIANGGSNVAYTEGVECLYTDPGAKYCHAFTGMFVDVLDQAAPDYVVFEGQNPDTLAWDEFFFHVGKGSFVLRCVGSSCPTDSSAPPARTVTTPAFTVQWSATNPEEIVSLKWNGSPNLTSSSLYLGAADPCANSVGGDSEFFGNSWGGGDGADFVSPVGWGTAGQWSAQGSTRVSINSSASGCYGTSDIPVATSYQFFPHGVTQDQFLVQRKFKFGSTPFDYTFRPYVPRLHPVDSFSTVLYPDAAGTSLVVVDDTSDCGGGCTITDWNASWFAVLDPVSGIGMIVRHVPSSYHAGLWIDTDYYSFTTSTAVALVPPAGGFTGTVIENERLCFFDSSSWTPSLELPTGCQ